MTILDVLKEARQLLQKGWCQNDHATDQKGHCVDIGDENAACWCLSGAVRHSLFGQYHLKIREEVFTVLAQVIEMPYASPESAILNWNDKKGRTQEEVLMIVDKAIAKVEQP
jgi:hypothetical protein